jgi:acyl-CoA thioester hydrolase
MPRLRLKPMASYPYSMELAVRITDLNYGGHLGNDRLLSLVHEARTGFLESFGFSEMDCGGISLTMADASLVYQEQAYGGDILHFEVAAGAPTRCGFRLFYRITRPADSAKIALVETGMVGYDYKTKKIVPLPSVLKNVGFFSV